MIRILSGGSGRSMHTSVSNGRPSPMRHRCALAFAVLAALATSACASSRSASAPSTGVRPSPNLITSDEIAAANVQNAFEAVKKLRPAMLRQRQLATAHAQASGELIIYVDNTKLGSIDNLRQISASSIATLRYFSASEAQIKWGSGHPGGVIEVITKR